MIHILVLEDDKQLNQIVCAFLRDSGYAVIGCESAMEALDSLREQTADLIISDIMMPGMNGFEFAARIREKNKTIPILFMTALDDISAKQKGFSLGVDDYMVKPVLLDELLLRVEALLRRANIANERKLTAGGFTMNADDMTASLNDGDIPLTDKEFGILFKLLSYPKRAFTRSQLRDEFLGVGEGSTSQAVDVCIEKIKEKLSGCQDFEIRAVMGLGYEAVLK